MVLFIIFKFFLFKQKFQKKFRYCLISNLCLERMLDIADRVDHRLNSDSTTSSDDIKKIIIFIIKKIVSASNFSHSSFPY